MRRLLAFLAIAALLAGLAVAASAPLTVSAACTWSGGASQQVLLVPYKNSLGQSVKALFGVGDLIDGCGHIQFISYSSPAAGESPRWAYAGLQVFENGRGIFDSYAFNGSNPPNGIDELTPVWTCHPGSDYLIHDTQTQKGVNYLLNAAWSPAEVQGYEISADTGAINCNVG